MICETCNQAVCTVFKCVYHDVCAGYIYIPFSKVMPVTRTPHCKVCAVLLSKNGAIVMDQLYVTARNLRACFFCVAGPCYDLKCCQGHDR